MEVTLRKERTSPEYQQILRSNLEEINRMSQIVEDLLLLSRADNGEIQLTPKEINLSEIVREIVPQAHILAESKNLHIHTLLPEDQVYILGDRLRIRELFLNLIENAIKYTEEGGSITIHLTKNHAPSTGKDNGNGLEPGKMGLAEIIGDRYRDRYCQEKTRSGSLIGSSESIRLAQGSKEEVGLASVFVSGS